MPIFRYFLVMGPVLLGLLFLADANLPPPGPLNNSTSFYGLKPDHAEPKYAQLAVTPAPAPDMTLAAIRAAEPEPAAKPAAAAKPVAIVAPAPRAQPTPNTVAKAAPKKSKHASRKRNWRNAYAEANPWGWRPSYRTRFW